MQRILLPACGSLLALLASGGCAPKSADGDIAALVGDPRPSGKCGFSAGPLNDRPPACELPTAEAVAWGCSINDTVTAPGYVPPTDEDGVLKGGTPSPEYRVIHLQCRFTTPERNAARCTFDVEDPAAKRTALGKTVLLEHRQVSDDGPTHHMRWLTWSPTGRCMPLAPPPA